MSEERRKRQIPAKIQKMKARKRQKLDEAFGDTSRETPKESNFDSQNNIKLDELQWKNVEIPDHMQDYGGFYGLEELDEVEVVKDQLGSKVSFKFAGKNAKAKKQKAGGKSDKSMTTPNGNVVQGSESETLQHEDEWEGFEDEARESKPETLYKKKTRQSQQQSQSSKVKASDGVTRTETSRGKLKDELATPNMEFSILEGLEEENNADVSAWKGLNLSHETLHALSKMRFARPSRIQRTAIPKIQEGEDLIGKAPTGSGKTLAFGIPIVEEWIARRHLSNSESRKAQLGTFALIVLPTRELAHQINDHLQSLIRSAELEDLRVAAITGGLSIHKQRRLFKQANIVVGTPGRIWEMITEGDGMLESLKCIKFLVIDEADRLLSEGHFKELEDILSALDKKVTDENPNGSQTVSGEEVMLPGTDRQTLIFSATFSKALQQNLSKRARFRASNVTNDKSDIMNLLLQKVNFRSDEPVFVDVNPMQQMAENLREGFVECPAGTDKDLYLYSLLLYHHPGARALVFVNSVSAVKRLVPLLNNLGLLTYPLQSHMPQKARLRSVERFSLGGSRVELQHDQTQSPSKRQDTKILVATDVAARGLDIPNISLVIHYHVPRASDGYIHRSGRTARASNAGSSILICAPEEVAGVRRLVAQVHAQAASSSSTPGAKESDTKRKDADKHTSRSSKFYMQALAPDQRFVSALKPRVVLAKKIADSVIVKDKKRKEDDFFRAAAEELGVSSASEDVSSDSDLAGSKRKATRPNSSEHSEKGKGAKKRREGLNVTQAEMRAMQQQLKGLLETRLNLGVSEKYFVSQGGEKVEQLLKERENGLGPGASIRMDGVGVLGTVEGLGWDS